MTASDLARIWNVSIRTIRRWAAADHWHRTAGKPKLYDLRDAAASYEKRHACG